MAFSLLLKEKREREATMPVSSKKGKSGPKPAPKASSKATNSEAAAGESSSHNVCMNCASSGRDSSDIASATKALTPGPADILLGRGRPYQKHPGNMEMRRLAEKHRERYDQCHRDARGDIATELLYKIAESGARFLKRRCTFCSGGTIAWEEATHSEAYEKMLHVLRSGRRKTAKKAAKQEKAPVSKPTRTVETNQRVEANQRTPVPHAASYSTNQEISVPDVMSSAGTPNGRLPSSLGQSLTVPPLPPVPGALSTLGSLHPLGLSALSYGLPGVNNVARLNALGLPLGNGLAATTPYDLTSPAAIRLAAQSSLNFQHPLLQQPPPTDPYTLIALDELLRRNQR